MEWPFKKVAFPGRDIDWDTWREIESELRRFEGPGGFVGPCEMLVAMGVK